jgi:hypothetical protein
LNLLMHRESREVEALIVWKGLLDVPLVPLADMGCIVACLRKYLGDGDLVGM